MSRSFNQILRENLNKKNDESIFNYLEKNDPQKIDELMGIIKNLKEDEEDDFCNKYLKDITINDKGYVTFKNALKKDNKPLYLYGYKDNIEKLCLLFFEKLLDEDKNDISLEFQNKINKYLNDKSFKEGFDKILEKIAKDAKATNNYEVSFDNFKSQWREFGKILTYKSIEMLNFASNSKTKVDKATLSRAMKDAFGDQESKYIDQFIDIDSKLDLDATLCVLKDIRDRGEAEDKSKDENYFKNYVDNMLNEEMDSSKAEELVNKNAERLEVVSSMAHDEGKKGDIYEIIQAVKTVRKDDFQKYRDSLDAAFDEGKNEMIEEEKEDTEKIHKDPVSGKPDNNGVKRVGRLGKHGPMTYIKNHEDLNKAVEAIDAQPWNIFNTGVKIMIKIFKLLEHSSKKWQEYKEKWHVDFIKFKKELRNKQIEDYKKDVENANTAEEAINIAIIAVAKYENQFLEDFKKVLIKKDENDNYIIDKDVLKKLQNHKTLLKNTDLIRKALVTKLETLAKEADKKKPEENKNESYSRIVEAEGETTKEFNDDLNKANKDAEKKVQADANKQKKEKSDTDKNKNYKTAKFNIDLESVDINFIKELVENTDFIKNTKTFYENIEKEDESFKEKFVEFIKCIDLLNDKDKGYFTEDNLNLKDKNFEQFRAKWQKLTEELNEIDLSNFEITKPLKISKETANGISGAIAYIDYEKLDTLNPEKTDNTDVAQITSQIKDEIKKTDRENYKDTINKIKELCEKLTQKLIDFNKNNENGGMINTIKQKQNPKWSVTQSSYYFHSDKIPGFKEKQIIPKIWLVNALYANMDILKTHNPNLKESYLFEAENENVNNGLKEIFKQIDICIPDDLKNDIYKKGFEDFEKTEYEELKNKVNTVIIEIEKNKDKMNIEALKEINIESVDKYLEFLKNENNDPVYKIEYILAYFENDNKEENNNQITQETQQQLLQITNQTNQEVALIANMTKKKELDRSEYEKLLKQFATTKESLKSVFAKNDIFDKNKLAEFFKRINLDNSDPNGSIVLKIFIVNKLDYEVHVGKNYGMKEEYTLDFYDPLLEEEYNENDVIQKIKEIQAFIQKLLKNPKDSNEAEQHFYKWGHKQIIQEYTNSYVNNIKAVYEQVKEKYEKEKDKYGETVESVMNAGIGKVDLFLIYLACLQIVNNKDEENKESVNESENNSNEANSNEENKENQSEEKTESFKSKKEKNLIKECFNYLYKYIRG